VRSAIAPETMVVAVATKTNWKAHEARRYPSGSSTASSCISTTLKMERRAAPKTAPSPSRAMLLPKANHAMAPEQTSSRFFMRMFIVFL